MSRAKRQDVEVLALTDHDTINGLSAAAAQAQNEGITLIPGIEFSCDWNARNIHIVGLNIDTDNERLLSAIESQHKVRSSRAELIGEKLAALGFEGALEGARKIAGEAVIGRPHFAQYLVDNGHCKSIAQAFKRYLGAGKPGDIKQVWPDISQVIEVIVASGGTAVLAHPKKYNMTRTKLCAMVADFTEAGGLAIEVVSGKQEKHVTADLAKIANKYGLAASCGSDFHVPGSPWQELGAFSDLPDDVRPVWALWG